MTAATSADPRTGLAGLWDRVVGPGMTRGETLLVVGSSLAGAAFALLRMADFGGTLLMIAVAGLIGLDVIGGAVCNATATTRAWYHRRGQGWRQQMMFIAPHLAYVAVVADIARGPRFDSAYALAFGLGLMAASGAIIAAPARLKNPIAFAAFLVVLVGVEALLGPTRGLEWFAPALLLKLLVGHLVGPVAPAAG